MNSTIDLSLLDTTSWFNWQQPAIPLLLGGCFEACGSEFESFYGVPFFTSMLYFRPADDGGVAGSWLLRLDEGIGLGRLLVDGLSNQNSQNRVLETFDEVTEFLIDDITMRLKKQPSTISKADIDRFFGVFRKFYGLCAITEPIQWYVEAELNRLGVSNEVAELISESDDIQPHEVLFFSERIPYALTLELQSTQAAANKLSDKANTTRTSHLPVGWWRKNNYARTELFDDEEFRSDIEAIQSEPDQLASRQAGEVELLARRQKIAQIRSEFLETASNKVANLITIGDRFGSSLADKRKEVMLQALQSICFIADDLALTTGVDRKLIDFLMPGELTLFLDQPDRFLKKLKSRISIGLYGEQSPYSLKSSEHEAFAYLSESTDQKTSIMAIRQGQSFFDGLDIEKAFFEANIAFSMFGKESVWSGVVIGTVANRPKTSDIMRGRVRVVRDPLNAMFERDEILVATSTTPDFLPMMKQAKAIITDQHGLTTHAALISNELGIPCIVGTGTASLLLKTGNEIEIDFQNGHVTKI